MMTVAELIAELQKFPGHRPVRVLMPRVGLSDESGDHSIGLNDGDAQDVDEVRNAGPWVCVRGRS